MPTGLLGALRGLRIRILLALAVTMTVALAPLAFAVVRLTRVGVDEAEAERALEEATLVRDAALRGAFLVDGATPSAIESARVADGAIASPRVRRDGGALAVELPYRGDARFSVRFRPRPPEHAAALRQLVVLYVLSFAAVLLYLAYLSLTRLIVRPASALSRSTQRVAAGGAWSPPQGDLGSFELDDLAQGIAQMADALLADQKALREKVLEVTESAGRLEEARRQLARSQRLASVGRLAAGLAHEIGNPLAALLGMEDLLLSGGLSKGEERDFLERMKRETERIHRVVRDLLDFARPEQAMLSRPDARGSTKPEAVADVREIVQTAVQLVLPQRGLRKLEMRLELGEGGRLTARIEADRLTQVLLNLLLNAMDAVSSGGEIVVSAVSRADEAVEIAIADDGPGIPASLGDAIFEPFVTTKAVGEGTGLGLAVCRGLVEDAGGTIAFDQGRSRGARVVVTLPSG